MIRLFNVYFPTRSVLLLVGETALVLGSFLLASEFVLGPDTSLALIYEDGLLKVAAISIVVVVLSYYFDLYEPQISTERFEIHFRILLVLGFSCLSLAIALYFWPTLLVAPKLYPLGFGLLTPVLILWRRAYEWIVNVPAFRERVYVLGDGPHARTLVEALEKRRDVGMMVVDWRPTGSSDPAVRREFWAAELRRLSTVKPMLGRIIVALEEGRNQLPTEELLNARLRGIQVERVTDLQERLLGKLPLEGLLPSMLYYGDGFRVKRSQQISRVLVSTMIAAIGLVLFLPFFPFVALAIKLTSAGPIFFKQTRVGMGGAAFSVYKFRSMGTDAERTGAQWAVKNDPRVTKIGRFMRKTRIDEIPQLWNVLRGDMGLVGPRPERPEFIPELTAQLPFYELRHLIRPGLTGWAQVRYGYGATLEQAREKLEYDLYYIKNMSLGLDLMILFETIKTVVRRRGQ